MLSFEDVVFKYEKEAIINELSYVFDEKKTTAIIGESGLGKTTVLNLIAGTIKPNKGKVLNDHKKIGYVFQDPRLFPWMTALENVKTVCNDEEKAKFYLDMLLPNEYDKYPHELSGGMKQRVSLARAMAYEPSLFLIDEPFKGLDKDTEKHTKKCLKEFLVGRTALLVTHSSDDLDMCDKVLRLERKQKSFLTAIEFKEKTDI
jgi:ABC-type nitrate/sulfonate/bicarbonate transport system ATPase subunit